MRKKIVKKIISETPEEVRVYVRHYADIVVRINELMQLKSLTKKDLADRLNKKPSKIYKLLKGKHNLTLKIIAKLEAELGGSIIQVVESKIKNETIETDDPVQKKIDALLKKAQESKMPAKKIKSDKPSSLHQIIKTKEQADRFMKKLREA